MNDFPEIYPKDKLDEMYAASGLSEEQLRLLNDYFAAFSEFYQILGLKDAFGIIKRQGSDFVTEENFLAFAEARRHDEKRDERDFFYILGEDEIYDDVPAAKPFDRKIVIESLVEFDFEFYDEMAEAQRDKPLYIPPKDTLLKYRDDMYFEPTPQYEALAEFFRSKMGMSAKTAHGRAEDCLLEISLEAGSVFGTVFHSLHFLNVTFTQEQLNEFIPLILDAARNTRRCAYRGFTVEEYAEYMKNAGFTVNEPSDEEKRRNAYMEYLNEYSLKNKIGRNDPCPCGSGKKYKKCCGR